MFIALGKRRRRPAVRKNRRVRPKTTSPESESSSASPPASIITSPSLEDYNPDIQASQEQADDTDIPASQDQEHSDEKKLPHDLVSSDGNCKVRIEYGGCCFASSPGKYPVGPPDFETAVREDAGRFYHNPSGGEESGWMISWYTVTGSYRGPGEESPSPPVCDDDHLSDWTGWPEGPSPNMDDIFAYIASLPTDYSAYKKPGEYAEGVLI